MSLESGLHRRGNLPSHLVPLYFALWMIDEACMHRILKQQLRYKGIKVASESPSDLEVGGCIQLLNSVGMPSFPITNINSPCMGMYKSSNLRNLQRS